MCSPPPLVSYETSEVEVGHCAQANQIHFGVGPGGIGVAVSEVITDLFEREAFGQKMAGTGMPERRDRDVSSEC